MLIRLRPVSNVMLLPYRAGSTVAQLKHGLASDLEFNSVEFIAVPKQNALSQLYTNNYKTKYILTVYNFNYKQL